MSESRWHTLSTKLMEPIDGASIAFFRMAFGTILAWEVGRYLSKGWVQAYYVLPDFHFTYWPFRFVKPWPMPWMEWHFLALGVAALWLAVGWCYRASATALCLLFSFVFLLEKARYLNHFYFVILLTFLMIWVPSHRTASIDAWWRPSLARKPMPTWALWLLRFQIGIPYIYGGIAKLNWDWLRGEPMRLWLSSRGDFPLLGPLFQHEATVYLMTYGGLFIDLFAVIGLLFRRTRLIAWGLFLSFHLINSRLFFIGIFPWMMIAATLIFFPPNWPRVLWRDITERHPGPVLGLVGGALLGLSIGLTLPSTYSWWHGSIGALGCGIFGWEAARLGHPWPTDATEPAPTAQRAAPWLTAALLIWAAVQMIVPLRHLAIPGDVNWTEEGHRWAWHMKLRDKRLEHLEFRVRDLQTNEQWTVEPILDLQPHQWRKLGGRPDMLVEYAHHLEALARQDGHADVEVRVISRVSLNGRRPRLLVDPAADLTLVSVPWIPPAPWILPLTEPLHRPTRQ